MELLWRVVVNSKAEERARERDVEEGGSRERVREADL